ncbi:MAG: leucine-rich repeat domain-containing protein [Ruminococcus sp.]|nr:leucine-rich repeat domain-containing protein [Ruminococcus sp.]
MKKAIFSILICSAAAMAFTSCSKVGNTESNSNAESSVTEETTAAVEAETAEATEKPTERVKDIQTGDDFMYEIIDGEAVITEYTGSSDEVEVPAEIEGAPVTKIGTYAFEAEYDITSVTLPESITLIAEGAFMDCSSLESINIPEAVGGIDRGAFVACTSLAEITIPANVQYIREEAFTACEAMTSLTINNPDIAYENWGLEELPELTVYAEEGSVVAQWAEGMGKFSAQ